MDTITAIGDFIVKVMDYLLFWLLYLPRPVAVLVLGVGSSLLLNQIRRWTTNQDQLLRGKNDLARLKQLLRDAKRKKDKPTVLRIRQTAGAVQLLRMKAECLPLLASILPITFIALWAFARVDYSAPQAGKPLVVRACYPLSSIGKLTVLVPSKDYELQTTAIQEIVLDKADAEQGAAEWTILPKVERGPIELEFHQEDSSVRQKIAVGGLTYLPPREFYPDTRFIAVDVALAQTRFGMPGAWAAWLETKLGCPPWLAAYLIVLIPGIPLLRKVAKVY